MTEGETRSQLGYLEIVRRVAAGENPADFLTAQELEEYEKASTTVSTVALKLGRLSSLRDPWPNLSKLMDPVGSVISDFSLPILPINDPELDTNLFSPILPSKDSGWETVHVLDRIVEQMEVDRKESADQARTTVYVSVVIGGLVLGTALAFGLVNLFV